MSIHINWGPPMKEIRREPTTPPVRWCFVCRKRRQFEFVAQAPIEPSYYGPSFSIVCERGHSDGDLFPGRVREWGSA